MFGRGELEESGKLVSLLTDSPRLLPNASLIMFTVLTVSI
jgi:hypothetical protein